MSQVICGLTFDQYLSFHLEFLGLMQHGAPVESMVACLKKHGQEPIWEEGEEGEALSVDYYMSAGLKPWEEACMQNPELATKKAMALVNQVNVQEHGELEEDSGIEVAGLSLEGYAEICATAHMHTGNEAAATAALATVFAKHGVRDMSHFEEINQDFQAAMAADDTGHLNSHYGRLFMKFQPQHASNVMGMVGEALAEDQAYQAAEAQKEQQLMGRIREMSKGGDPKAIAQLVRDTYPEEDDEDTLDYWVEKVVDELAEDEAWDRVEILLAARFEVLQPGGSREDWVADELESLK